MIRSLLRVATCFALAVSLVGCGGGGADEGIPEDVDFSNVPPPVSASMKPVEGSRTAQPKTSGAASGVVPAVQ